MIDSAKFTQYGNILLIMDGQEYWVPDNLGNMHRQLIAQWEQDGHVIEPYVAAVVDTNAMDTATMNAAMLQDGSIIRAIAAVQFDMIKGVLPITPSLTLPQYKALLKAKMR